MKSTKLAWIMSVVIFSIAGSTSAIAQNSGAELNALKNKVEVLENRVNQIEKEHIELISDLEKLIPKPGNPTEQPLQFACRIRDTFQKGSYLGKSSSKLLAASLAKQNCKKAGVTPVYCGKAVEECEQEEKGRTYACVLTDSYSYSNFDGIGTTKIEAAHVAQINCEAQASNKAYCAGPTLCEELKTR